MTVAIMQPGKAKEYFEDCELGETMRSQGRTVSEADIHQFAGLTGDWNPLHTDAEFAAQGLFGERIAHGPLVFSLGIGLSVQIPNALPKHFIAAYGIDRVRFSAPTKIGDTLHTQLEIVKLDAKDDNLGVVTTQVNVINQRGETACSYQAKAAVARRPQP
ncbi:MAG: MaoC/PaaZ C-terminal domain-containing protein [Candidatus Pelagadaptatus aseana]|uniref:MaoC/PaaZ C-terminal domain-containing protein n=1 Tax=Candidatus Pelagadaptatus aseana TaxID=3120508 RepID=UPI0039B31145